LLTEPEPVQVPPASTTILLREEYLDRNEPLSSSHAALSQERCQNLVNPRIQCNRPSGLVSIPVVLLHPIFGQFVDNCRDHVATQEDHRLVHKLSGQMSNFLDRERDRQEAFINIMRENLGLQLSTGSVGDTSYSTDRHAMTMNDNVYVISEAKLELGCGTGDPAYQSASYYLEFVRKRREARSVLPVCIYITPVSWEIGKFGQCLLASRSFHRHRRLGVHEQGTF
jgi:hypothetical protein